MLLLASIAANAAVPTARAERQATATVRLQRSQPVNEYEWKRAPKTSRHEVIIHDEEGRPILLRLVEHQ